MITNVIALLLSLSLHAQSSARSHSALAYEYIPDVSDSLYDSVLAIISTTTSDKEANIAWTKLIGKSNIRYTDTLSQIFYRARLRDSSWHYSASRAISSQRDYRVYDILSIQRERFGEDWGTWYYWSIQSWVKLMMSDSIQFPRDQIIRDCIAKYVSPPEQPIGSPRKAIGIWVIPDVLMEIGFASDSFLIDTLSKLAIKAPYSQEKKIRDAVLPTIKARNQYGLRYNFLPIEPQHHVNLNAITTDSSKYTESIRIVSAHNLSLSNLWTRSEDSLAILTLEKLNPSFRTGGACNNTTSEYCYSLETAYSIIKSRLAATAISLKPKVIKGQNSRLHRNALGQNKFEINTNCCDPTY